MDCKTARLLLELHRPADAEVDAEEARALEQHLDHCPECSALARAERGYHRQVGLAMRQVAVPPELRGRLLSRLDKERGDYYRQQAARGIRTAVALAACLLIAVFFWRMRTDKKPSLDVQALVNLFAGERCDARDKDGVEQWFADHHGIKIEAPSNFDYGYLLECGVVDCQGAKVPCLTFARPELRLVARVYIVSEAQFNPDSLKIANSFSSGGAKAEIWRIDGSEFAYVILYTGQSLDPFKIERLQPAA
jgi:hypothetical protein